MERKTNERVPYRLKRSDSSTFVRISRGDNIIIKLYAKDNKITKTAMLHKMMVVYIKDVEFDRWGFARHLIGIIKILAAQMEYYQKKFGHLLPTRPK